ARILNRVGLQPGPVAAPSRRVLPAGVNRYASRGWPPRIQAVSPPEAPVSSLVTTPVSKVKVNLVNLAFGLPCAGSTKCHPSYPAGTATPLNSSTAHFAENAPLAVPHWAVWPLWASLRGTSTVP